MKLNKGLLLVLGFMMVSSIDYGQKTKVNDHDGLIYGIQREKLDTNKIKIYTMPDVPAEFPGGKKAMYDYLKDSIQYPICKDQGRVYLNFVVEKDGSISNIKVLRGLGDACDREAIRVVSNMPKWEPAKLHGILVRSRFTLPVKYSSVPKVFVETAIEGCERVYNLPDQLATFPDGLDVYLGFETTKSKQELKQTADSLFVKGKVEVKLVVTADGTLTEFKAYSGNGIIQEEGMKIIKKMPNWTPAAVNNENVCSYVTVPVDFGAN